MQEQPGSGDEIELALAAALHGNLGRKLRSIHHEIEIDDRAAQQATACGRRAIETNRLKRTVDRNGRRRSAEFETHSDAPDQHDPAVVAREIREWPGRRHIRETEAPGESPLALRSRRDLRRGSLPVLPGIRRCAAGATRRDGRIMYQPPNPSAGSFRPYSRAQSIAMS